MRTPRRSGTRRTTAPPGRRRSPRELGARAWSSIRTAARSSGRSGGRSARPPTSARAGHGIVRRQPKFDAEQWKDQVVGPKQYVRMNAKELYREVRSRLPVLPIGLPSEFIRFETDAEPFLTAVLDQSMTSVNHDY